MSELDWSVLTVNTDDQERTNTNNLRPESIEGLNAIGKWAHENIGDIPMITGGAETFTHAPGTYSHHTGWKADLWLENAIGGTEGGDNFKAFCNSLGYSANWEGDHWDIDFSGNDSRDRQSGEGFSGSAFGYFSNVLSVTNPNYQYKDDVEDDVQTPQPLEPKDTTEYLWDNFTDTVKHLGVWEAVNGLWNRFTEGTGFKANEPLTSEDIEYVKAELPDDEDLQKFCLFNASNSAELRSIVEQKKADNARMQEFEAWRENNASRAEKVLSYVAGGAGYILDPTNYIPLATPLKGVQIAARLGNVAVNSGKITAIANNVASFVAKHPKIAEKAINGTVMGTEMTGIVGIDMMLQEKMGGRKYDMSDYAFAAAGAFLAGGLLGTFRGASGASKSERQISEVADRLESQSIASAADVPNLKRVDTIERTKALHDLDFGKSVLKSKFYKPLEDAGRLFALSFEDAFKLVKELSGREISKDTKAFYVPNEGYSIIIKDNIDTTAIDKTLVHEFVVHGGGIKKFMGDESYDKLMSWITKRATKQDTDMFRARQYLTDFEDAEELLAFALENPDKVPLDALTLKKLRGNMNTMLGKYGFKKQLTDEDIQKMILDDLNTIRLGDSEIYLNENGTTAFGGLQFSQVSHVNPITLANYLTDADTITNRTQRNLPAQFRKISKWMEQGIFGETINSLSNTIRKYSPMLWNDARGRGLGNYAPGLGMSAETYKMRMMQQLAQPYFKYASLRRKWLWENGSDKTWRRWGTKANAYFDRLTIQYYNTKYGGNVTEGLTDVPPEVKEAAEYLREFYSNAETLMKNAKKPLMDSDWEAIDLEFTRRTTEEQVQDFIGLMGAPDVAKDELIKYFREAITPEKFEICRRKILRDNQKANEKIAAQNEKARKEGRIEVTPPRPTVITDDMVDAYYEAHIPEAVDRLLKNNLDDIYASDAESGLGDLGSLGFLKARVPIDTSFSKTIKLSNGEAIEFSFDTHLRHYDIDNIFQSYMNRAAGEQAVLQVFGTQTQLAKFMKHSFAELDAAVIHGKLNKHDAEMQKKHLEDAIRELRGLAPKDERGMSTTMAALKVLRDATYAMRGAMMGINQLAEASSTIAYGGLSQLYHVLPPQITKHFDDIKYGKVDNETLTDTYNHVFGEPFERQIWNMNTTDYSLAKAVANGGVIGRGLKMAGDLANVMGKMTSTINLLPRTTEWMTRGIRTQTMVDTIKWAHGGEFNGLRNPFSKAKLEAAHINEGDARLLKYHIQKYTEFDADGRLTKIDWETWKAKSPLTFNMWYELIQNQTERALVFSARQGNRNLWKSQNQITQLMCQFKDFSLRSINAQSMRGATARDMDDAIATVGSMLSNALVYAMRGGLMYGAYKALGEDDESDNLKTLNRDNYFSTENLLRAGILRSTMLGAPLSFMNDLYEGWTGAQTTRTTVDRAYNKPSATLPDKVGNFVNQIPAASVVSTPLRLLDTVTNSMDGDKQTTKKDLKNILNILPLPNFFPVTAFINHVVSNSGLPDKNK